MPIPWIRAHKEEITVVACLAVLATMILHGLLSVSLLAAIPVAIAGATVMGLAFFRLYEKRLRPIRFSRHPELGELKIFRDRWEAVVPLMDLSVELSGDVHAEVPTDAQVNLFKQIKGQLPSVIADGISALKEELESANPPVDPEQVILSGISLGPDDETDFSLFFDIPSRRNDFPWGLYVDFSRFSVTEAGWTH